MRVLAGLERVLPHPAGRFRAAPALLAASLVLATSTCAGEEPGEAVAGRLAVVDTVLSELGGQPTAGMSRGQRWRMISSVGAGLPPSSFEATSLPDPQSRGAILVLEYCQRCHWLPAPQMHSAAEWPVLVRRMVLRARTLQDRMGGPATTGMLGEILVAGMASADVPSTEEVETLLAYLQANALATADAEVLGDDAAARRFVETCSQCHDTPSPGAHTAEEWAAVVARMRGNTALMDVPPIAEQDAQEIVAWLAAHAGS